MVRPSPRDAARGASGRAALGVGALVALFAACTTADPSGDPSSDGGDARATASPDVVVYPADAAEATSDGATDAPRCCAPDPTPAGCMSMGGAATLDACPPRACDFFCSTNWRLEPDPSGCPTWRYDLRAPLPDEGPQCIKRLDAAGIDP